MRAKLPHLSALMPVPKMHHKPLIRPIIRTLQCSQTPLLLQRTLHVSVLLDMFMPRLVADVVFLAEFGVVELVCAVFFVRAEDLVTFAAGGVGFWVGGPPAYCFCFADGHDCGLEGWWWWWCYGWDFFVLCCWRTCIGLGGKSYW
jgi:hypothetical protein